MLLLAAPSGFAEAAGPVTLRWEAPSGCPPAERVQREVARLVGNSRRLVQVHATVTRESADRFRVRIELQGAASGKRTLTAGSCESAARAAGLIVALAIDPQAATVVSDQIEHAEHHASQAPTSQNAPAAPAFAQPAKRAAPRRFRGVLFSGVWVERALLPGLGLGAELGGGMQVDWLRSDLALLFAPAASATSPSDPTRGANFAAGGVILRLCPGVDARAVELHACAALRATRLWVRGTGVEEPVSAHGDVASAALGAIVRWPRTSTWAAELGANLVVPFNRPQFVVENVGQVHRPAAVGASAAVALGYRF